MVTENRKEGAFMATYEVTQGCCYCGECLTLCPFHAIFMDKDGAHIKKEVCRGCGICARNCASEAITKAEEEA